MKYHIRSITCYGSYVSFPRNKNDPNRRSIKVSYIVIVITLPLKLYHA